MAYDVHLQRFSLTAALVLGCGGDDPSDTTIATEGPGQTTQGPDTGTTGPTTSASATTPEPTTTQNPSDPSAATTTGTDTSVDEPTTSNPETTATTTGDSDTDTTDTTDPTDGEWAERDLARVFLSGHSLTDNPLPEFVLAIAQSRDKDFNFNQQIGIGSPIRVRTLGNSWNNLDWPGYKTGKNRNGNNMDVIAELQNPMTLGAGERYDTLIITERHDILGTIQWEDTAGLLRHYHDRLIAGNADGHTLFYHSWLDVNKSAPEAWITHEKQALVAWECIANKINLTLEDAGRSDRITVLPVGAALVDLVERALADEVAGIQGSTQQKLDAIFNDNVHLTPLGVYYAALVTYAAVFRSSPVGAAVPDGVPMAPAADLQAIAWDYVRAYYQNPEASQHTMEACRDVVANQVCGSFWTLLGNPNNIQGCQNHFSQPNNDGNPFKWPDPNLMVWPDP